MYICYADLLTYFCKPEHSMSELMKEVSTEAYNTNLKEKMWCIVFVLFWFFLTKGEVSKHDAIQRIFSMPMTFQQ